MVIRLIDLHSHILPQVDDGAANLSEALHMAEMAAVSGVTHMVCTPHFRGEMQSLRTLPEIARQFTLLKQAVGGAKLPLTLSCAAEILCTPDTVDMAAAHRLPTLDGKRYLLTEFYFDESPQYMNACLSGLAQLHYTPVIAHPERYDALQRDAHLAEYWFRHGYLLQLNKGSILGAFGSRVQHTAHRLLADGAAHLVASDAHHAHVRTPDMTSLTRWLRSHCNPAYAEILLLRNPRRILDGRPPVPV